MKTNLPHLPPALVIGASIGGLTAALSLARAGLRVALFDQAGEMSEVGGGIQLGPDVYRMFDYLGLTRAIEKFAVHPDHLIT